MSAVRAYGAPEERFRGLDLRPAPPPPALPEKPYPLLQPYTHPDTFTGRAREIAGALSALRASPLLLCTHAASGAGKSSFLQAGLLPELWKQNVPVVLNQRPDEPGIARRLAAGLVVLPEGSRLADDDLSGFVHLLDTCAKLAGKAPVIILDQFEDAFRRSESGEALARLGPLLAASTELEEPPGRRFRCRWVLSYREEYHGHVVTWLHDVLRDARARGRGGLDLLPHDLSRQDYFREMPIEPLGVATSRDEARAVFLEAITKPLGLRDGEGEPRYALRFEEGASERLAEAFAEARMERPRAPLLPELQVVLYQLVSGAVVVDGTGVVDVPADVRGLITNALGRYLEDVLKTKLTGKDAKRLRAVALQALVELADAEGKRGEGLAPGRLEEKLGVNSKTVLPVLQEARLVVRGASDEGVDAGPWVLPHDWLADVVVAIWNDAEKRRAYEVDDEVIEVQKKVRRRMEMHRSGEAEGTALPEELFERVGARRESLLWDEECEAWWKVCVDLRRRRREARKRGILGASAIALLGAAFFSGSSTCPDVSIN